MKEWLVANWPYLVIAIVYVAERTTAISAGFAKKIRMLVQAISTADNLSMTRDGQDAAAGLGLAQDPDVDVALDSVEPHDTPRVSKGKRIWRGLLKILPLVSRLKP